MLPGEAPKPIFTDMLRDKLKLLREAKNLSTRELGEMVNVAHVTISKYQLVNAKPRSKVLKNLAKALEVPVEELIDEDNELERALNAGFTNDEFKKLMQDAEKLDSNAKRTIYDIVKSYLKLQKFNEAREITKNI